MRIVFFILTVAISTLSLSATAKQDTVPRPPILLEPSQPSFSPSYERGMCFFGPARKINLSKLNDEQFIYYRIPFGHPLGIRKENSIAEGSKSFGHAALEDTMILTLTNAPSAEPTPLLVMKRDDGSQFGLGFLPIEWDKKSKTAKRTGLFFPEWPMEANANAKGFELLDCRVTLE